jgi:hypothetical protein
VPLVKAEVSEERIASITSVTRIDELGTVVAVTGNRITLPFGFQLLLPLFLALQFFTLMMKATRSSETSVLTRATQRPSQKTAFFIVTAVETSTLT